MKRARSLALVLLLLSFIQLGCNFLTVPGAVPPVEATATAEPSAEASVASSAEPSAEPSAVPSMEPVTATPTALPVASPTPTTAPLELEIVQSQTWTDRQGNARVNVLFRNPYDFPVAPGSGARATLRNSAGEPMRDGGLYFLDGISGGVGFLLPGETIAANACFTCEEALLTEEWAAVEIVTSIVEASDKWAYSTEVEPSVGDVSFDGDSPIFWVTGTVKNNSAAALQRISVRIIVFDQEGRLVGAAEASAWDVGPGAVANIDGYGIGQAPAGPIEYEVTALGVNY